jgi:hypothetical protein
MRILRVRRGFSTNCSGANEYFPPSQTLAPPTETPDSGPWQPTPSTQVVFRWVTFMPDGAPPPLLRQAMAASDSSEDVDAGISDDADITSPLQVTARDGGSRSGADADERGDAAAPPSSLHGAGGVGVLLFAVMLAALALFGLERIGRRLWRRLGRGADEG